MKAHGQQQQVATSKPLEYHCTHCAKQSLKQVFASLLALEQHVTHMHTGKGEPRTLIYSNLPVSYSPLAIDSKPF